MKKILILLFFFAFNSMAALIDVSSYEDYDLADILEKVNVEVEVDASIINEDDKDFTFRVKASKWLSTFNWETHVVCDLVKNGDKYTCSMEGVDMARILKPLSKRSYYQVSVSGKRDYYSIDYCKDIIYNKKNFKIDKSTSLFVFHKYTLKIEMNDCSFKSYY